MFLWIATCVYMVIYAAQYAYGPVGYHGTLLWGMPPWVVYGVLAPWFIVTIITVWYALFCMKDEELGEDFAANE
jgi:hypothetical protein